MDLRKNNTVHHIINYSMGAIILAILSYFGMKISTIVDQFPIMSERLKVQCEKQEKIIEKLEVWDRRMSVIEQSQVETKTRISYIERMMNGIKKN